MMGNKKTKAKKKILIFTILPAILILSMMLVAAVEPTVELGNATGFVLLSKAALTDTSGSAVVGLVGASPITAASIELTCGELTGTIWGVDTAFDGDGGRDPNVACFYGLGDNKTFVDSAVLAMGTAYTNVSSRVNGTGSPDYLNEGAGILEGLTLYPGIHKWTTPVSIGVTLPGDVTLDCQGNADAVFIMQVAGTLDVGSAGSVPAGNKVLLTGSCKASNVFWAVTGVTTLGTYSTFEGTILSTGTSAIILQTGSVLTGRALSDGQITLDAVVAELPAEVVPPVVPIIPPVQQGGGNNNLEVVITQRAPLFSGLTFSAIDTAGIKAWAVKNKNLLIIALIIGAAFLLTRKK